MIDQGRAMDARTHAREKLERLYEKQTGEWADDLMVNEWLDILLLPETVVCGRCGGKGYDDELGDRHEDWVPCSVCDDGRVEKGPIAYLAGELEQVDGWRDAYDGPHHWGPLCDDEPPCGPLYRLPTQSGSTQRVHERSEG